MRYDPLHKWKMINFGQKIFKKLLTSKFRDKIKMSETKRQRQGHITVGLLSL